MADAGSSAAELQQYARFLGVEAEVARHPPLAALLQEGLSADVPPGWRVVHSEADARELFFVHEASGLVLNEHPADKTVRHRIRFAVEALDAEAEAAAKSPAPPSEAGTCSDDEYAAALDRLQPATLQPQRDEFDDILDEAGARPSIPLAPLVPQAPPLTAQTAPELRPTTARVVPLVPVLPPVSARGARPDPQEAPVLTARDRLSMMEARVSHRAEPREVEVPDEFLCPITAELMRDPVVTADGFTYERCVIARWLETHSTSPCSNAELVHKHLAPNLALRKQISALLERHPQLLARPPVSADDYQSSDTE